MASSPETAPLQADKNEKLSSDDPSILKSSSPVESPSDESPPSPPSPSPPEVESPPPDLPTSPPPDPPTPLATPPPEPPEESSPPPPPTSPATPAPPTQESPSQPPPTSTPPSQSQPPPPIDSGSPPPQNSSPPPPSTASSPPAPANPTPIPSSPPRTGSPPAPVTLSPPKPGPLAPQTGPPHVLSPPPPGSAPASSNGSSGSPPTVGGLQQSPNSTAHIAIIAGIVCGGILLLALFTICLLIVLRKKKKRPRYMDPEHPHKGGEQYYNGPSQSNSSQPIDHVAKSPRPPPPLQSNTNSDLYNSSGYLTPPSPNMGGIGAKSQFTYEELAIATCGFSQANLLGQGGFGFVHKGLLPDGKEVAVKSLKSGSGQGEREFQAEVEIISRVHHRHLVSLVGYCIADGQRMLVYEFVPNQTLEFHLHGNGQPVMDWATRVRIAVGSAKGLAYLHEDCHPRIIHRDIKAANILLDFNYEAMVADFGLAKLSADNNTHVSTRVMGTFGYLAPEYASSGKLTEKSDVFSFGVMLLELITGRRPIDLTNVTMEDSLVDWARPRLSKALEDGNYDELVDPRLQDNYDSHELARMVTCAAVSIRHSARRRPKMSQIVRALDGVLSLDDMNEGVKPGHSAMYNPNGNTEKYNTCAYNADMDKFRKMVMSSQEFSSSECGATSDYGHNPYSPSNENEEIRKL